MKARDRCKANYQGDKCRLEEGHECDHQGQFNSWSDESAQVMRIMETK